MLLKRICQAVADWEHTLAHMCLWQSEISALEGSPDMRLAVDIGPLKGEQLRTPYSRNCDQPLPAFDFRTGIPSSLK
jgi:hypothetical protein